MILASDSYKTQPSSVNTPAVPKMPFFDVPDAAKMVRQNPMRIFAGYTVGVSFSCALTADFHCLSRDIGITLKLPFLGALSLNRPVTIPFRL